MNATTSLKATLLKMGNCLRVTSAELLTGGIIGKQQHVFHCTAAVALLQRVAELEKVNAEFLRTKQQLEQEFNQKRAKFKELYLAKEEDLKRQNAVLQAAQDDLGQLRTQLMEAHAEMENIKAIATVSENTKQEAIDEVKRQWQEEVASLQAIMKETVRDYELQYHHRLEQERAQWNQYRENVEREIAELRRRLSEGQEEENLENEMKKVSHVCATQYCWLPRKYRTLLS
ncbi:rab GTPase-binding effector protein 1 isoform X8 [Calonectris borealis]|uniref:rab GTPase-binding effector protein 1 isoform X8 n=1 Tax=Calonectris borealis TaxID=1323832 RepID=UPI003F4B81F0